MTDTYLVEEAAMTKEAALSWTDERVDRLRRLWIEGLSASRIAAELAGGVTRNAVIGKVHRLGLSGRSKGAPAASAAKVRPSLKPVDQAPRPPVPQGAVTMIMRGDNPIALRGGVLGVTPIRSSGDNVVALAETVTIMDLREAMCRWPVGDPSSSEFRYCGGKAPIGGGPYCAHHSRMAYQPVQDRNRRKIA